MWFYCVTPVPIGLGFGTALGLGLKGPDLRLGLDNKIKMRYPVLLRRWCFSKLIESDLHLHREVTIPNIPRGSASMGFSTLLRRPEQFNKMAETDRSRKSRKDYSPRKSKGIGWGFTEGKTRILQYYWLRQNSLTNRRKSDTNVLNSLAEPDLRIEYSKGDKSSFSQVKTLLQGKDWLISTCDDSVSMQVLITIILQI